MTSGADDYKINNPVHKKPNLPDFLDKKECDKDENKDVCANNGCLCKLGYS